MSLLSGCVLPLGPQFQDPPAEENFAPVIEVSMPMQGSIVTAVTQQVLSVTVTDPNVGDDLFVRWIGEYPPYSTNSQRLMADVQVSHSANGERLHKTLTIGINCLSPLARIPQHPITALVSDRPFWDPSDPDAPKGESLLTGLPDIAAQSVQANWVLNLSCQ